MSLAAVSRVSSSAPFHAPVRTAPSTWSAAAAGAGAFARVIQPVYGSNPFLAQHLAQEVLDTGPYVPRWRERAAAYAAAPATRTLDLTA
jgi:hypothetical protein